MLGNFFFSSSFPGQLGSKKDRRLLEIDVSCCSDETKVSRKGRKGPVLSNTTPASYVTAHVSYSRYCNGYFPWM